MGDGDLRIELLGRFRVQHAGRTVEEADWRLRKARTLVKLLALAPGHRLPREQVLDTLWPDLDPGAADNNLRYALFVARKTLGVEARALGTHGDTVQLSPPGRGEVWVDVGVFERLAAEARGSDDPRTYRAALDAYGGELLPEDPYEDWAAARRDALRLQYLGLLLALAGLHERRGAYGPASEALARVVEQDSTHEEAHAGLMRLYALSGQRSRALRQYERLAEALERELDAEPDPSTRSLLEDIRAGRIAAPSAPSVRVHEAAGADRVLHNIPHPLTSLVGREEALADLGRRLDTARLLTLAGPGGVGKTRLATALALDRLDAYADGAWLVALGSVNEPPQVPGAVASVLGLREEPRRDLAALLAEHLRQKHVLLVLDNCEHVLAATAVLAEHLLRACPHLRIVTTSREPLHTIGEATWRVPVLDLPRDSAALTPAGAAQHSAVRLFVERAQMVQPRFALTEATLPGVLRICRDLDGLPLAIELAAARLHALSVDQVAARLDDRFRLLAGGNRTAPRRHQALRHVVDWSYSLLTPPEQRLMAELAVFVGGWSVEAAEAVAEAGADTLGLLCSLVEKSLVAVAEGAPDGEGESRYWLLETLRHYARERLAEQPEVQALAQRRHAAYFLTLAETAAGHLNGPEQAAWLERLNREYGNLRAALQWAQQHATADMALRLSAALWRFWLMQGYLSEGRAWLTAALSLPAGGLAEQRGKALAAAGGLAHYLGDFDGAVAAHAERLALHERLGDIRGAASAANSLGCIATERGDYAGARAAFQRSLAAQREGDGWAAAATLHNMALVALAQGERAEAERLCQECLDLWRQAGDRWGIAQALNNHGFAARTWGEFDRAERFLQESLGLRRELGDRRGIGFSLFNLGAIERYRGAYERATTLHQEGLAMLREVGDRVGVAMVLDDLARVRYAQGSFEEGLRYATESLQLFRALGARMGIVGCLETRARLALGQGQRDQAARLLALAQAEREAVGSPVAPADAEEHAALVAAVRAGDGELVWQEAIREAQAGYRSDIADEA